MKDYNMELVTVTCLRDLPEMLLQAESISKFLEPCIHWVIINEEHINHSFWEEHLRPYYKNHQLNIIFPDWNTISCSSSGYTKQQFYKFDISRHIQSSKYLILDSKNFFIRSCKIIDWSNQVGSNWVMDFGKKNLWYPLIEQYKKILKMEEKHNNFCMSIHTPFVMEKHIINKYGIDNILRDFSLTEGYLYSEFLFYSLISEKFGYFNPMQTGPASWYKLFEHRYIKPIFEKHTVKDYIFFPMLLSKKLEDELLMLKQNTNIYVTGFHRDYVSRLSPDKINQINEYICSIGLNRKIYKKL
jgi:hypothetical protein